MNTFSPLLLKAFKEQEQGSVGILFSLMSIALLFLSGMAIDYNRISDVRGRVSSAVDSASLAAGRAMLDGKLDDAQIVQLATTYFKENSKPAKAMGTVGEPAIAIDRDSGSVNISVRSDVAMTVSRIGGFKTMTVPVVSQAVYKQKDIEIGMALDITGSMQESIHGIRKIDALKGSFQNFADRLIPENNQSAQKVRIGLAPYSAGINLGDYAGIVSNGKSKDGCVIEAIAPAANDLNRVFNVGDKNSKNIDPKGSAKPYSCPTPAVVALTDQKDNLINSVKSYSPLGSTGGHFGIQWAWNLVSDQWASTWGGDSAPESYDRVKEGKLLKAVVLMTDGEFNTAYHNSTSASQAIALCNAIKAKGVVVFSVGFGLGGDAAALNTLKTCASEGDDYFADASSPEELDAAFQKFAGTLTQLRISK